MNPTTIAAVLSPPSSTPAGSAPSPRDLLYTAASYLIHSGALYLLLTFAGAHAADLLPRLTALVGPSAAPACVSLLAGLAKLGLDVLGQYAKGSAPAA